MSGDSVDDRLRRWRLVLGGERADGTGVSLTGDDVRMDGALEKLYGGSDEDGHGRGGAVPGSATRRPRWRAGSATSASTSRPASCR